MSGLDLSHYRRIVRETDPVRCTGKVTRVVGLTIEVSGIAPSVGEICSILSKGSTDSIAAEVVGFKDDNTLLMPLGELEGIAPGCRVVPTGSPHRISIGKGMLGQVLDGLGRPMDPDAAFLGEKLFPVQNAPPNPLKRARIDETLETGIKVIDLFATCGKGQRLGIFSGSGVGKSTLLGMIARYCKADVNVIGLIGERGREVKDFLEKDLGPEGIKRSVVVVATSDQPPLVRIKGAFVTTAIAEYFRDKGLDVMLMMDSVTRFAAAQREVGLAIGEPPATRGYTPSVYAILPRLLERAGRSERGSITGLYSVLVEADDMNEPVADTVRGILDGHIVLSRDLAAKNHFPAVDVLHSISRLMPDITNDYHRKLAGKAREIISVYEDARDLISVGAYEKGANPEVDAAIEVYPRLMEFLRQQVDAHCLLEEALRELEDIIGGE
ncbi:MAG TPA: flagellar protein export ATPase FliI [Clostridia bacterium]|jgi:flagellum-specific ATP synthase|nr:flagellar protein export ATPase FliI [Clostridia bacterium]